MRKHLLSFGHGYSAQALACRLLPSGWKVTGTTRDEKKIIKLRDTGIVPLLWGDACIEEAFSNVTAVLISVGPSEKGDPVFLRYRNLFEKYAADIDWVGYLSTTGVYGDFGGQWVDEETMPNPQTKRGQLRFHAEKRWQSIPGLPLHIFRLAGIYGPGRDPFSKVRNGTAKRIIKKGQVFSRIHVDDIAQVLAASLTAPNPGRIYNVCDDNPAPPQDVVGYAAELLELPLPPIVNFETAELSPMARSFYAENKKVSNTRLKSELGVTLFYPDYKIGLKKILRE
ncbi:MAG: NAD(P)-dependent oxidoreductase [Aestuariivita sp.]|nr:NAD(P)-dependent oxidoreductase [Aestuariivita sp.]